MQEQGRSSCSPERAGAVDAGAKAVWTPYHLSYLSGRGPTSKLRATVLLVVPDLQYQVNLHQGCRSVELHPQFGVPPGVIETQAHLGRHLRVPSVPLDLRYRGSGTVCLFCRHVCRYRCRTAEQRRRSGDAGVYCPHTAILPPGLLGGIGNVRGHAPMESRLRRPQWITIVLTVVAPLLPSIAGGWFGARQGRTLQAEADVRIAAENRGSSAPRTAASTPADVQAVQRGTCLPRVSARESDVLVFMTSTVTVYRRPQRRTGGTCGSTRSGVVPRRRARPVADTGKGQLADVVEDQVVRAAPRGRCSARAPGPGGGR